MDYSDQIITLGELEAFLSKGYSLEKTIEAVKAHHGLARIFDADTKFGPARYFVILLTKEGDPLPNLKTKAAKA